MLTLDIIISVMLAIGLMLGLRAGIIKQATSLMGVVVGLLVGRMFYTPVGDWLMGKLDISLQVSRIAAFALIMAAVPFSFSFLGKFISRLLNAISLGWVNRLLGGLVGVLTYILFLGIVITGIESFDPHDKIISQKKKDESMLYYSIYNFTDLFFDHVKSQVKSMDHVITGTC